MTVTLANLAQATEQEVADHIVRTLAAQGFERAVIEVNTGKFDCMYRTPDGKRCAGGACISDEEYAILKDKTLLTTAENGAERERHFEGTTWGAAANWGWVPKAHVNLIIDLQGAHDAGATPEIMKTNLAHTLKQYKLSHAVLDQCS